MALQPCVVKLSIEYRSSCLCTAHTLLRSLLLKAHAYQRTNALPTLCDDLGLQQQHRSLRVFHHLLIRRGLHLHACMTPGNPPDSRRVRSVDFSSPCLSTEEETWYAAVVSVLVSITPCRQCATSSTLRRTTSLPVEESIVNDKRDPTEREIRADRLSTMNDEAAEFPAVICLFEQVLFCCAAYLSMNLSLTSYV